jgi:hypothetical protein
MSQRRFPPPWTIEALNDACFVVSDASGQKLGYVYFEEEPGPATGRRPRYIDSINARSASGLRIMVQRFFNSMMP